MVPILFCLLALLCVALGLATSGAAWFFVAIALIVLALGTVAQRRATAARSRSEGATASDQVDEFDEVDESLDDAVWVIDGRPRYHLGDCVLVKEWESIAIERAQAVEDAFVPCAACRPDELAGETRPSVRDQQG